MTPFSRFARACGYSLTPAQAEFARAAFDGLSPSVSPLGQQVWGGSFGPWSGKVAGAVAGARSGKTLMSGLRALQLAIELPLVGLGRGELAVVPVVAPDIKTATQTVRFALGAARELGGGFVRDETKEGFTVRRGGSQEVRIEARAASAGGKSIRGRSMPCAVLDEAAFFFADDGHRVVDTEIFAAVVPRVMPGGQLLVMSTPWAEAGLLHELWSRNFGRPQDALMAHAPTLLMRAGDPDVASMVAAEELRDPDNARREYGAEFLATRSAGFFPGPAVKASVTGPQGRLHVPGLPLAAGADFAFRSNASALAVVQRDRDLFQVLRVEERLPGQSPMRPSELVADFASVLAEYGLDSVTADGHYRESIQEHLEASGMWLIDAPAGQQGRAEAFQVARQLLAQGRVRLPDHDRLLRQLREVTSRPLAGGGVSIDLPRWPDGSHGDLAAALVLALWEASRLAPLSELTDEEEARMRARAGMDSYEIRRVERMADELDDGPWSPFDLPAW